MVTEKEWALMCEPYLTGDSGVTLNVQADKPPMPKKSREELIEMYRSNYALFLSCAVDTELSEGGRIMAYEAAISSAEELGLLGVSPYPLNRRRTYDTH